MKTYSLAPLSKRFCAACIDIFIAAAILFGLRYLLHLEPDHSVFVGFLLLLVIFLLNYRYLINYGQTIGKRILHIRIVTISSFADVGWRIKHCGE